MQKDKPDHTDKKHVSATRLRIGIFLIILFWIPAWLAIPAIADAFGIRSTEAQTILLVSVLCIQGVLGALGAIVVGRTIVAMVKTPPKRKVLGRLFYVLVHGETKELREAKEN